MNYTVDDIMATKPCKNNYPRERVANLFSGRESISLEDVAGTPIPAEDRLWLLISLATPRVRQLFAARAACDVLLEWQQREGRLADVRLWNAIAVTMWYADCSVGEDVLYAAWDAAWDAAWHAGDAAGDAAWERQIQMLVGMMEA